MHFAAALPRGGQRVKSIGPQGEVKLAPAQQQWNLYAAVQQCIQEVAAGTRTAEELEQEETAQQQKQQKQQQEAKREARDPQRVLDKLRQARGELDVIVDLVTNIEQQQFVAVAHAHSPHTEAEAARGAARRLVGRRAALGAARARLAAGAAALAAQAAVDNRFLADLRQLRDRWKLRRHAGTARPIRPSHPSADAMFYADISLLLHGPAAQGVTQEGALCNIIQDTNGDACMVEPAAAPAVAARDGAPGAAPPRPCVVRGWRAIDAALEARQRVLTWGLVRQLLARDAQLPQHERDADGAVAALLRLADAAAAAAALAAAAGAAGGTGSTAAGTDGAAMDVDAPSRGSAAPPSATGSGGAAWAPASAQPSSMQSSAAREIEALLALPSTPPQFEARALQLLAGLLGRRSGPSSAALGATGGTGAGGDAAALLPRLLRWLRHAALCLHVDSSLRWQVAAARGAAEVRQILAGDEDGAAVWRVRRAGWEGQALVVAQGGAVRLEGTGAWPARAAGRGGGGGDLGTLSRRALDALLLQAG
eukprot:scaffold1.g5286.t1